MLPKNWGEPMGAPAIFEKQIEIKLSHPASTLESRIQVNLVSVWIALCIAQTSDLRLTSATNEISKK
ncbi:MAG: hypothetical protein P8X89_11230 [Reinekea sp.]